MLLGNHYWFEQFQNTLFPQIAIGVLITSKRRGEWVATFMEGVVPCLGAMPESITMFGCYVTMDVGVSMLGCYG